MKIDYPLLKKVFSPRILAAVIRGFDRATLMIIGTCWMMTVLVMVLAMYTVNHSAQVRRDAEAALAVEPVLPKINHTPVGGRELQVMIDRLQKRYPEIAVTWQTGVLNLSTTNGGFYRQWLTAIGQVDTLYPQFRWKVLNFCVGKVCGQNLMGIDLVGERIEFEMPQPEQK